MASKRRPYELSRRAQSDLESIYAFTAENWSRTQADRYIRFLYASFRNLSTGANVGRDAELGNKVMKLVVRRHVVYFTATETSVLIVRVLHGAMDAPRHVTP